MYYVAISNTTEANNTECKEYVSQCLGNDNEFDQT